MAKTSLAQQVKRYIWFAQTIKDRSLTRAEINDRWRASDLNEDHEDAIPESTFYRWRTEVQSLFDIDIECENGKYFIAYNDRQDEFRQWLIESFSISNILKDSRELKNQLLFEPMDNRLLTDILEAMRDHKVLRIMHEKFTDGEPEITTRTVKPYGLKQFKQRWYMVAEVKEHGDKVFTYSLDRITNLERTGGSYKIPDKFNIETYFDNVYGITMPDEEPQKVVFSIANYQANYLRTLPLHPSQEEIKRDEHETVFSLYVYLTKDFLRELRAYGPELKVLEPKELRDELREDAEELAHYYKDK